MARIRPLLLWLVGSAIAVLVCASQRSAAFVDGRYIPSGNDSFYHAHRILTAVHDLNNYYEFDPHIHAPEGSLLIWPWGYDLGMALLVKGALATGLATDPMKALDWIPVLSVTISVALIIALASVIGLKPWAQALAVACFVASPLTQILHGLGCIDHHFVEFQFVLGALLSGLLWMRQNASTGRAAIAGAVLGAAPVIHSGLFILQIPMLACLVLLWLRGSMPTRRSTIAFVAALLGATILVLLPSVPFRQWKFDFYLLSWFHLYAAICTSAAALLLQWKPWSPRALATVALCCAVLALPLLGQLALGRQFVTGQIGMLGQIEEARSVLAMIRLGGPLSLVRYYSGLIVLAPIALVACLWLLTMRRLQAATAFFLIFSVFGLVLLLSMFRLQNYGSFALYLPALLAAQSLVDARPVQRSALIGLCWISFLLAYAVPIRSQLLVPWAPGSDFYYGLTRAIYPAMERTCQQQPGIVLATADDGHYITYHTRCDVIADNFLMTPQHESKLHEVELLMGKTPGEILEQPQPFRYVYVRFTNLFAKGADGKPVIETPEQLRRDNPRLIADLLLAKSSSLDPRLRLIDEKRFTDGDGFAFARLFEILPAPGKM